MGEVVRLHRHKLHRCEKPDCWVCRGGLIECVVCGGAEGDLPRDCPGYMMLPEELESISSGRMDYFRQFGWIPCDIVSDLNNS